MQAQFLRFPSPACLQHDVANCFLPTMLLSKNRLALQKKQRTFVSVYLNRRKGMAPMRVVSETVMQKTASDSSANDLTAKDLETQNETLEQQPQQQELLSSTGQAPLPPASFSRELSFTEHHLLLLGFVACLMTGALSCLLLAAIPTLMAMKRAAESLGKLADTAREELPGTMAAVRLSGMEISDLTMELSDLGQEISAGVRNSSRAVRAAEDGLRRIGTFTPVGEGERTGGGGEASSGSRSKKYPRGTDASSQFGSQLDNSGSSL